MNFSPHFIATLDDEVRAFIHMSGIILRENAAGGVLPIMEREGMDWVLYLHRGDPRTIDYWREVALRGYGELPPK